MDLLHETWMLEWAHVPTQWSIFHLFPVIKAYRLLMQNPPPIGDSFILQTKDQALLSV